MCVNSNNSYGNTNVFVCISESNDFLLNFEENLNDEKHDHEQKKFAFFKQRNEQNQLSNENSLE